MKLSRYALPVLIMLSTSIALAQDTFAKARESGPLSLVIAYRVKPESRVRLRQTMEQFGVSRFEKWRDQGLLKEFHLLFNSYLDSETYDMLTFLTFYDFRGVERWKHIEKESPGGLPGAALALIQSAITYSLDLAFQSNGDHAATAGKSVFLIIPYELLVPAEEYAKYAETYVVPQLEGWMKMDVLATYRFFITRYSTERPFGSLLVLEYRDHESFGKRETTVAKTREALRLNATWMAASQNKQNVRIEKQTILAEEVVRPLANAESK